MYGATVDLVTAGLLKGGAPAGLAAAVTGGGTGYTITGSGKCAAMTTITGP